MNDDDNFKQDVRVALAKIDAHMEASTVTIERHGVDIAALKKTVNGNGEPGLAEKVRNLESNWKAITAGISFIVSVAVAYGHRVFTGGK